MRFKAVELRFYGDLVDFLAHGHPIAERTFDVPPSVKDTIEACGVPHPEVDLILMDGESVGWDRLLEDGSRIAVYPRFRAFDVAGLSAVHVDPPQPRFLLDVHLGTLARYLRLLGFDAEAPEGAHDEELATHSAATDRILLTRDLGLLKRSIVRYGHFLRSPDPVVQAVEVVRHYDLGDAAAPFARCMMCNGLIDPVAAADVQGAVPPRVRRRHDEFRRCRQCGRCYWEGSHHPRLQALVDEICLLAGRSEVSSVPHSRLRQSVT